MAKGRTRIRVPMLVGAALFSIQCTDAAGPDRPVPQPLASHTAGSGIQLDQWNGTIGNQANPLMIVKGFNPTNPHVGDAIVATFFWFGTPGGVTGNIIESVTDVLTTNPFTPVGNRYDLVEFVSNGNVSMATYVATNVQGFPDAGTDDSQILAVKADLTVPVPDAGVLLSAWIGVAGASTQALGEHRSASGTGTPHPLTGPTTAAPGAISVNPRALAYGFSMSSPPAGVDGPAGWSSIAGLSDLFMAGDGRYDARFTVSPSGGAADPQWNWFFTAPGSWLATVLALNAAPTTGNLMVTTTTSGENTPTNNYTVTLDGTTSQSISPNGEITFPDLQPGDHEVALSGVPENCEVTSPNPVTVTVVAGETATTTFTVTCNAPPPTTGNLKVTTTTSGENIPTDDYTVTLDGTVTQSIPPTGEIVFTDLEPGNHEVALSGVPENCQVTSDNPQTVDVVAGETAEASFTVTCSVPPPPPPPPPPNDKMTGGGKLRDGREFATFGFVASSRGGKFTWVQHCPDNDDDDDDDDENGHNTGPATSQCSQGKFTFKGTVTPGTYAQGSRGPNCRTWSGTGTSKRLGSASFTVQACDNGERGRGVDYIEVTIDGYENSGFLAGGNIQLGRSPERDDD